MTPAELEALAVVMKRHRVLKCGDVELHPSAFDAKDSPAEEAAPLPVPASDPVAQNEEALLFASSLPMTAAELGGGRTEDA